MADLKSELERLASKAGDPTFASLERARAKHLRTRRLTAGALAVAVAVAGVSLAVRAFDGASPTQPIEVGNAWQPMDPIAVWPESPLTARTPADAQAAVDAGDQQWRLDPAEVARRFVREMLGRDSWVFPPEGDVPVNELEPVDGRLEVAIHVCPAGEVAQGLSCDVIPSNLLLRMTLVQPADQGSDGIWSVASVVSPGIEVDVLPNDPSEPAVGHVTILFETSQPNGWNAGFSTGLHAGFHAANDCRTTGETLDGLSAGRHTLTLSEPEPADPSCGPVGAGYVFAYATDATTIPSADPIAEPTAIEFPWITVLPIYVAMQETEAPVSPTEAPSTESQAPNGSESPTADPTTTPTETPADPAAAVLVVDCGSGVDPSVESSVEASPDGVHVRVETDAQNAVVGFSDIALREVDGGVGEFVLDLVPGHHFVKCPGADVGSDPEPFEVVDPNGYWVYPFLDCVDDSPTLFDAAAIVTEGDPADELHAYAEATLTEALLPDVVVDYGGYPDAPKERVYLATARDGTVVARMQFTRSGPNSWFPDGYSTCEGSVIY